MKNQVQLNNLDLYQVDCTFLDALGDWEALLDLIAEANQAY